MLCGTGVTSQQADLLIVCVPHHTVLNDKGHKRAMNEDENYSRRLSHCCFGHHLDVFTVVYNPCKYFCHVRAGSQDFPACRE